MKHDIKLTKREQKAIDDLHALARRWPKTLWCFANGLGLSVLKKVDGDRMMIPGHAGGVDPAYEVAAISAKFEIEGGDW